MLIPFQNITSQYGTPNGIIHIGAHAMEERQDYFDKDVRNVIWIEANPALSEQNKQNISPTEKVFEFAASDTDGEVYDFNLTNNGQSSSILELGLHKHHHPHVHVTETIKVTSKRIDTLLTEESIDIKGYNFINLDIQGAELLALKGFGDLLKDVKYIYTEVNTNYVYKNCCLIEELDDYLSLFGFDRVATVMTHAEWGDALYVNKNN